MVDEVIAGKTRNRRVYASYYTESAPILDYMVHKLSVQVGDRILEPCAGGGAFIADILDKNAQEKYEIVAYDLNPKAVQSLNEAFIDSRVEVIEGDTLTDIDLDMLAKQGGEFDKVIGNPPYGAWQDMEKRKALKLKYGGYVRETYSLFLQRCIALLKDGGRLVFIVPDTYLGLNLHKGTREFILSNTYIEEIALFPSKFFPGVNFGYSNLSIITLVKSKKPNPKIKILSFKKSLSQFAELIDGTYSEDIEVIYRDQKKILDADGHPFHLNADNNITSLLDTTKTSLGDLANCVTGFYSGDNQKFLYVNSYSKPSLQKYSLANKAKIYKMRKPVDQDALILGLEEGTIIPIHKGGRNAYIQPTEWYVAWGKSDVEHYHTDKRARFQNARYYFREGLAVPMVRSKKLKATLLDGRLFDQSVVGIFPHKEEHLEYLLALLNSDAATKIINSINHTANNSANYLKKFPVIIDEDKLSSVSVIYSKYDRDYSSAKLHAELNEYFGKLYGLAS